MAKARIIVNQPSSTPPLTPVPDERNVDETGQSVSQLAFDSKISIIEAQLKNSGNMILAVIVVLIVAFITLFFNYYQFTSTSYNEYSQRIKEMNDDRFDEFGERIKSLEDL